MVNPFDQFDRPADRQTQAPSGNPFDQFDGAQQSAPSAESAPRSIVDSAGLSGVTPQFSRLGSAMAGVPDYSGLPEPSVRPRSTVDSAQQFVDGTMMGRPSSEIGRTWSEAMSDTGIGLRSMVRNMAGSVPDIVAGAVSLPGTAYNWYADQFERAGGPETWRIPTISGRDVEREVIDSPLGLGDASRALFGAGIPENLSQSMAEANALDAEGRSALSRAQQAEFEGEDSLLGALSYLAMNPSYSIPELISQAPQFAALFVPGGVMTKLTAQGSLAGGMSASDVRRTLSEAVESGEMSQHEADQAANIVFGASTAVNTLLPRAVGPNAQALERVAAGRPMAATGSGIGHIARATGAEAITEGIAERGDEELVNIATGEEGGGAQAQALGTLLGGVTGAAGSSAEVALTRQGGSRRRELQRALDDMMRQSEAASRREAAAAEAPAETAAQPAPAAAPPTPSDAMGSAQPGAPATGARGDSGVQSEQPPSTAMSEPDLTPRAPATPAIEEGVTREQLVEEWRNAATPDARAAAAARIAAYDAQRNDAGDAAAGVDGGYPAPDGQGSLDVDGQAGATAEERGLPAQDRGAATPPPDLPQFPGLTDPQREVESRAADQVRSDPEAALQAYTEVPGTDGGRIVNTDEAREIFPEYSASAAARSTNAVSVHEPASWVANETFRRRMASPVEEGRDASVFFTGGGTGAGKSTGPKRIAQIGAVLDAADTVFDGNLSSERSAVDKIELALSSGRDVHILYTFRDPAQSFVHGALPRAEREDYGRTVPTGPHASTHIGAAETYFALRDRYANDPRVSIRALWNDFEPGVTSEIREATEEEIRAIADTDRGTLQQELNDALEQERQAGRVSDRVYRGTRGDPEPERGQERRVEQPEPVAGRPAEEAAAEQDPVTDGPSEPTVEAARRILPRNANLNVVRSMSDIPSDVRDRVDLKETDTDVEGFYDAETQSVYVIEDQLVPREGQPVEARAAWVAAHEWVGHHGVRTLTGDQLGAVLRRAANNETVAEVVRAMERQRPERGPALVEEALVELAAAVRTNDYAEISDRYGVEFTADSRGDLRRLIDRLLNALRRALGWDGFTDAELYDLISDSAAAAAGGPETVLVGDRAPRSRVGTRNPTAVRATESGVDPATTVGYESFRADPKAFERNTQLLLEYPGIRRPRGRVTPNRIAESFIEHSVANLLELHDRMPAQDRAVAKDWYVGANREAERLASEYGITDVQAAASIAALSPQKDWFQNLSLAERVIDASVNHADRAWDPGMSETLGNIFGGEKYGALRAAVEGRRLSELSDPVERAAWIRTYDQTHNDSAFPITSPRGDLVGTQTTASGTPARIQWGSLAEVAKAVSVLEDGSLENVSALLGRQHKIRSFYNNIIEPTNDSDVTIDTHAVAAALLRPLSAATTEVGHNFGTGTSNSSVTGNSGMYGLYAEAYRRAAAERGILPREMQSITWEAVRALYLPPSRRPNSRVVRDTEAAWNEYKQRRIEHGEAVERAVDAGGGIRRPDWAGSAARLDEGEWRRAFRPAVSGAGVPGRGSGPVASRGRGSSGADRGVHPDAAVTLNIGLSTAELRGGGELSRTRVMRVLRRTGANVLADSRHVSDSEPTLVVDLDRPLTAEEGNEVSAALDQEAIVQRNVDGTGELFGPQAENWGPYNPAYFVMPDGDRADRGPVASRARDPHVDTPEFRRWFGDSKVVDENGEPLVVHHGTDATFTEFDIGRSWGGALGPGFYFGDEATAERYANSGNVMAAYLSIQNPAGEAQREALEARESAGEITSDDFTGELKKQGYDGYIDDEMYVAFEPTQIKSATGNRGTFDPSDPSIIASRGRRTATGRRGRTARAFSGKPRQPDAVSADAYHYSNTPGLTELDPTFAGTAGAGRERRAFGMGRFGERGGTYARLNFYVREEGAPVPGAEDVVRGAGGSNLYRVQLDNLYDLDNDPRGIAADAGPNVTLMEEEIADAGFDGFLAGRQPGIDTPVAVVFDLPGTVPVENVDGSQPLPARQAEPEWDDPNDWLAQYEARRGAPRSRARNPQVDTPQFRRWFGDSKVVDENGDPMVVYHGTRGSFDAFEMNRPARRAVMFDEREVESQGAFFSEDEADARSYGRNVMPVYLSVQNPFTDPADVEVSSRDPASAQRAQRAWEDAEYILQPLIYEDAQGRRLIDYNNGISAVEVDPDGEWVGKLFVDGKIDWDVLDNPDVVARMKERGYDGARVNEPNDDSGTSWFVVRPEQIKSATGNRGTFDPSDPSIIASRRRTPADVRKERGKLFGRLAADGYQMGSPTQTQTGGRFATVKQARDSTLIALHDKMLPLLRAQQRVAEDGRGISSITLDDAMNAYRAENLMHGAVNDELTGLHYSHIRPIQEAIRKSPYSIDMFEDYLYAKAAPERNREIAKINKAMPDAGSGIETKMAKDILSGKADGVFSGQRLTPEAVALFDDLNRHVRALRNAALNNMVDAGQITPELAKPLREKYPNYVPMRGKDAELDEARGSRPGTGRGLSQRRSNIRRALGRGADNVPVNILGELVGDAQRSVVSKGKAKVARAMLRFALANPNPDLYTVEPVDLEWRFSEATGEAYLGVKRRGEDVDTSMVIMHKGNPVYLRFNDPQLATAMLNAGVEDMGKMMRVFSALNRWRSATLTRYNPAFTPVNMARDFHFGTVAIAAEHGPRIAAQTVANYPSAMRASYRHAAGRRGDASKPDSEKTMQDWAAEAYAAGMSTGITHTPNVVDLQRNLQAATMGVIELAASGRPLAATGQALYRTGRPIIDAIENANEASENAIRLGVYVALRKDGMSKTRAAEYAKNVTINFNRKGKAGPILNAIFLFYNAAMQGGHAVLRVMRNPKVVTYLIGLSVMQGLLSAGLMDDDDGDGITEWDKIPDYVKRTSLIFPLSEGKYFAMPMPYGFNWFTYLGGRGTQRMVLGDRPTDSSITVDLAKSLSEAFSPIPFEDGYRSLFGDQVGLAMGLAANRDDFGTPIAQLSPYEQYPEPRALQGRVTTPGMYHVMAQLMAKAGGGDLEERLPPIGWLDVAPEHIEEVVNHFGGGITSLGNRGLRAFEQMHAGNLDGAFEGLSATPITSRLLIKPSEARAIADRYYSERGEFARHREIVNNRIAQGVSLDEAISDRPPEYFSGAQQATYKRHGRRQDRTRYRRGEGRVDADGNPVIEYAEGSPRDVLRSSDQRVKSINGAVREIRAATMTNAELAEMYASHYDSHVKGLGTANAIEGVTGTISDIGLPEDFDGEAKAPARVRNRAIKILQDMRAEEQRRLLRSVEYDRTLSNVRASRE